MIKLVVFDLDGVLVSSKDIHFRALNIALREIGDEFAIAKEQHLNEFDGLPTRRKLAKLTKERGLQSSCHDQVWERKQQVTFSLIEEYTRRDSRLIALFARLRGKNIRVAVCSNSIFRTIQMYLDGLGLLGLTDRIVSNEDVKNSKPNPEMYLRVMADEGISPAETLIIEDSHVGMTAALASGAHVCRVNDPDETTEERIFGRIEKLTTVPQNKWQGDKMNILIPMAGAGSRFLNAGYTFPKPLIEVHGKPMVQVICENLAIDGRFIFVVRKEHREKYQIDYMLQVIVPGCEVIEVDHLTEGAACTTLLAREFIDNDDPLLIANSDQFMEWNSSQFMYHMTAGKCDGGILTFESTHPKWSYVKLDGEGYVTEVAEKKVISNKATVGVYYWSRGSDYVKHADQMIEKDIRVNNEFYVAPVYNEAIADNAKIRIFDIERMWGLGTPEDLNYFLENYQQ